MSIRDERKKAQKRFLEAYEKLKSPGASAGDLAQFLAANCDLTRVLDEFKRATDGFAPSRIAEMLNVDPESVRKYAKLSGVPRPARGKWTHKYTPREARMILAAASTAGTKAVRILAAELLQRLG